MTQLDILEGGMIVGSAWPRSAGRVHHRFGVGPELRDIRNLARSIILRDREIMATFIRFPSSTSVLNGAAGLGFTEVTGLDMQGEDDQYGKDPP